MKSIFRFCVSAFGYSSGRAASAALVLALVLAGCNGSGRNEISASGTIEATEVDVAAQVGGRVQQLRVDEGSQVRAGDTLAILDTTGPRYQFLQAQGGVDLADAQLRLLLNGARVEDVSAAEAQVQQAQANLKTAQDDERRTTDLFAAGSATRKQKDDAEARLTVGQAQLQAAQQGLDKLERYARPEDIASARARLAQAEAARDLAQENLANCFITAPTNGTVTSKVVEVGDLATPGGIIAAVTQLDTVNLMIYVTEVELARVKLGADAEVKIDVSAKRVFPGKVVYISPVAEFTPKNIQTREDRVKLVFGVKIAIPNSDGTLKPGLPADATVKAAASSAGRSASNVPSRT
jgi:HlyD family secretion protein